MTVQRFRIPASTSNLGPGFDALGLAFNRYLDVSIEPAGEFAVAATGVGADAIPQGMDNLILRVALRIAERRARRLTPFHLRISNEIPLTRGLGSSATAIIAGITCYELVSGDCLKVDEIFRCAFEFEAHPDNLAASLYGGLISAAADPEGRVFVAKMAVAPGAVPLVVIPEFELLTERARKVLPETYSRADVVYNIQRASLALAAMTSGQWPLLREAMRDRIHQPYRMSLIPGLQQVLELDRPGLLGVALSGGGPTVLAFAAPPFADEIGLAIVNEFRTHGVESTFQELQVDMRGRVISPCFEGRDNRNSRETER